VTLTVKQHDDGAISIHRSDSGGEGWVIEKSPDWGIKINTLGSSRIPLCVAMLDRPDVFTRQRKEAGIEEPETKPVPMIMHCPDCHQRHIDEGVWATKAHHTHSCQSCGVTWRPAVVDTVGVQFLPGFKNP
jgi:hypothetical protein